MAKSYSSCHSCGKEVEFTECPKRGALPKNPRCEVMKNWLSLTRWKGRELTNYYDFCSFSCLQKWVDTQVPKIPEVFRKAFEEENK